MKKETIQTIASTLHALADLLADETLGAIPDAAPEALTGEPVTTGKRRGRPAGTTVNMTPAEPSSTPATASSSAPDPKEEICTYCGYARGNHFADGLHCPSNMTSSAKPLQSVFTTAWVEPAPTTQAKTAEDLWIENKAIIEPLVKAGRGQEVTAVVNKYVSGPGLKMKDIPVDKIPAFRRDIEALTI